MHSFGTSLLGLSTVYLDKLLIGTPFGFSILGIYNLESQFLLFLRTIPETLFLNFLPQTSAGDKRTYLLRLAIIGSVCVSLATFLALPYAISTFFPNFAEAILPAQIMSFALVPLTFSTISRAGLFAAERSSLVLFGSILFVSVQSATQVGLGWFSGTLGLALSVLLAYSMEACYYLFVRRQK